MSVADRLKTVRTDAGLSQKELADKLGMPLRTYGSYERGERDISTAILLNICKTLNVSSDYILGRAETNPEQPKNLPHFDNLFPVKLKKFPLLGEIACGEPIFADEDKESFVRNPSLCTPILWLAFTGRIIQKTVEKRRNKDLDFLSTESYN